MEDSPKYGEIIEEDGSRLATTPNPDRKTVEQWVNPMHTRRDSLTCTQCFAVLGSCKARLHQNLLAQHDASTAPSLRNHSQLQRFSCFRKTSRLIQTTSKNSMYTHNLFSPHFGSKTCAIFLDYTMTDKTGVVVLLVKLFFFFSISAIVLIISFFIPLLLGFLFIRKQIAQQKEERTISGDNSRNL